MALIVMLVAMVVGLDCRWLDEDSSSFFWLHVMAHYAACGWCGWAAADLRRMERR